MDPYIALVEFVDAECDVWFISQKVDSFRGVAVGLMEDGETHNLIVYSNDHTNRAVVDVFREAFLKGTPFADVSIQLQKAEKWEDC